MAYKVISIFSDTGKIYTRIEKVDKIFPSYKYQYSTGDEYHDFFETYEEAQQFKKECKC